MGTPSLAGKFRVASLKWLNLWFNDPNLVRTITYSPYAGRSGKGATTLGTPFQIKTVLTQERLSNQTVEHVDHQVSNRKYIFRASDLVAKGLQHSDLNLNDNITDDGGDFCVTSIDRTLGFVILIEATGDR